MNYIITIGYQKLAIPELVRIRDGLHALIVDCRYNPVARVKPFGASRLEATFGVDYIRKGHVLGGREHTTQTGIYWIDEHSKKVDRPLLLMCQEEIPGDCHRHTDICAKHFPEAMHIFRDEVISAGELRRAESTNDTYEISMSLEQLLWYYRHRRARDTTAA